MGSPVGSASARSPFGQQRLQRAVERANAHWFPVNEQVVTKIRAGLRDGSYDLDIDFLLADIRSDFGLFTYVCRELAQNLRERREHIESANNPFDFLRSQGLPTIRALFFSDDLRFSTHSLVSSTPIQAARIREAMVSASAVSVLSEGLSISSDEGFSVALLRQLGLALIAWNYPSVYQRALENSDSQRSLSMSLSDALGFSPALLGSAIVSDWGFLPGLEDLISGTLARAADSGAAEQVVVAQRLLKLCEVGEALARAENPESNPNAAKDLEFGKRSVTEMLGDRGMRKIEQEIKRSCEGYRSVLPTAFEGIDHFDPERKIQLFSDDKLSDSNPFIRSCNPNLRRALKALYSHISPATVSPEALRLLAHEVLPSAGFGGGCIYAYDPTQKIFWPRLKFGTLIAEALGPVQALTRGPRGDQINGAFHSATPSIEHVATPGEMDVARIAIGLGSESKVAVLYLEISELALSEYELRVHHHLKAIRCAFEHALGELPRPGVVKKA